MVVVAGGRCSEVGLCYEDSNWECKMMVFIGRWSLFRGRFMLRRLKLRLENDGRNRQLVAILSLSLAQV